jgi:hypothetical protein
MTRETKRSIISIIVLMAAMVTVQLAMGRQWWGINQVAGIWSTDINSETNSQFLFDVYTFTHIIHGIGLYLLLYLVARKLPVRWRLVLAVALEAGWEILENSSFIINRYRAETITYNYYGDSIINSLVDIGACIFGFFLAWKLPKKYTILIVIGIELLLLALVRDNLTLNIIMLLYPIRAIKIWQMG